MDNNIVKTEEKPAKLKMFETCELVRELEKREGVEVHWVEPCDSINIESENVAGKTTIKSNGPAIILVVVD